MAKISTAIAAAVAALVVAGAAQAAPPTLVAVAHQDRYPAATFSAPGAQAATIFFASRPDRATDGRFLEGNVERIDFLTADELQRGVWLDSQPLDPGLYYVMLRASDCVRPNCTEGFSNVLALQVPKPPASYQARVVAVLRFAGIVSLRLTVSPLGEELPYRVCWRLKSKRRACVTRRLRGYSWNSSATDTLTIRMRGMARRTTFTWHARGRRVAARTVNTTRR